MAIYPPLLNPEEDGPSLLLFVTPPPAESLGNQVGRLTFIFLSSWGLEAHTSLRNGCRCHRHCDFWCVIWFHGTCGIQTSRRVSRDYICLNSSVILSTLLHLPYPDRGVVWHSVQSVFTRLFTLLVVLFCPPGYVHLYVKCHQPIAEGWTVFHHESGYRGALSRRVHTYSLVQPGPVPAYRFYCLSARDTVLPYSLCMWRS